MTGIIILNYQTWELSLGCMRNLAKTQTGFAYHIYLVDNASERAMPQEMRRYLSMHKDTVSFLQAKENRGYAAGNNIGICKALKDGCEHMVIANNDIRFRAGAVAKLIQALDGRAKIGIAGPMVVDKKGNIQPSRCSMETGIKEVFQIFTAAKYFFRKKWVRYYCLDRDPKKAGDVYYVSGCCFAISRACAKKVMPLDEGTFLYGEELILGIRMEQSGYRTWYTPESTIVHAHGATVRRGRPFMQQCICESELYYCSRYLHAKKWQLFLLYHYRRGLYWLRSRNDMALREYWEEFEKKTRIWYGKLLTMDGKGAGNADGWRS